MAKKKPLLRKGAARQALAKAKAAVRSAAGKATRKLDATARKAAKSATVQARAAASKPKAASPAKRSVVKPAPAARAAEKVARVKTVPASAPAQAISVGQEAPEFSLPGDDGKLHALSEHRGHPVVLYFYPKDNTPGCTQEACDFRDNLARVQSKGAVIYGVSRDSLASHAKFRDKYQLNFPLLSDAELTAHRAYGTWGKKKLYGREFEGTIRSTFLIDRQGRIAKAWPKVSVSGHADEVLAAINALP